MEHSLWGADHDRDYQKVLQFYVEHPTTRFGPPRKDEFLPIGTKVEIKGDVEVSDGTTGWIRSLSDDGWSAWVSDRDAKYDGTATWGIWCSWSVLSKADDGG